MAHWLTNPTRNSAKTIFKDSDFTAGPGDPEAVTGAWGAQSSPLPTLTLLDQEELLATLSLCS